MDTSNNIIEEYYAKVPKQFRALIESKDFEEDLLKIGRSHGLHIDELDILMAEVKFFILGINSPDTLKENLKSDLSLDSAGVDVLINRLNPRWRNKFIIFGLLAGATFTGIVVTLGAHFVWDIGHTDSVSADLEVPMWIVYLAVPLGSYLMSFRFLQVTWQFIKTGVLPKHDHAFVEGLDEELKEKGVSA